MKDLNKLTDEQLLKTYFHISSDPEKEGPTKEIRQEINRRGLGITDKEGVSSEVNEYSKTLIESVYESVKKVLGEARTPTWGGIADEDTSWEKPTLQEYWDGWFENTSLSADDFPDDAPDVSDLPQSARDWISARTLLGDAEADVFRELSFFPVVDPMTDELNANALRAVLSGRGESAEIPESAKESAQEEAERLLNEHFSDEEMSMSVEDIIMSKMEEVLPEIKKAVNKEIEGSINKYSAKEIFDGIYKENEANLSESTVKISGKSKGKEAESREVDRILKADHERKIIHAVAIEADAIDAHGDVIPREEVQKAAESFMLRSQVVGLNHEERANAAIVGSMIVDQEEWMGKDINPGSWIIAIKVFDEEIWRGLKEREFGGVSIGGFAKPS